MALLSSLVPSVLEFYRTVIPQGAKASRSADETTSPAVATESLSDRTVPLHIYGSVSTTDVVNSIKALLANHPEGSRIALTAQDITFNAEDAEDGDRLKRVGVFDVTIRVKDATVRRTIRVHPQE